METQSSPRRDKAIQELLRGQEFTCQLKLLLTTHNSKLSHSFDAEDLMGQILSTLNHSISLLKYAPTVEEVSQLSLQDASPKSHTTSSGDKASSSSTTTKDRPGCYRKRKKAAAAQSWVKESPTLVDDGYAWRKYGQKQIQKSEFPRHYYRCTHKFDQKCSATKQVQMVKDRPSPLYRTTYSAHHTCNNDHLITNLHGSSHEHNFLVESIDSSHLISFSNCSTKIGTTTTPFLASLSASSAPVVKQQQQQESPSDDVARCHRETVLLHQPVAASSEADDDYSMLSSLVDDDFDQELSAGRLGRHDENYNSSSAFMRMMMMTTWEISFD